MNDASPWDWLNFRYQSDDVARFTVVLDAVEEAARSLQSGTISGLRLALVITDYIADILLHRRVARVVMLSQNGPALSSRDRFDASTLGRLRQGFNRRVALAARDYRGAFTFGLGTAILDASDAEVLRVAHAYRNDVYHADSHNETTLPAMVRVALHAVVGMWAKSLPENVAGSAGARGPLMKRLEDMGYEAPAWTKGSLSLHAGARAVERWLHAEAPMRPDELKETLVQDIEGRIAWAESMVEWLASWNGPGRDSIEPGLRWHDFWRQHGGDPELLRLDEERAEIWERAVRGDDAQEAATQRAIGAASQAYERRFLEIASEFRSDLSVAALPQLLRRARAISDAQQLGTALARYRALDMDTRVYESTIADVAISWEEHLQSEIDRSRGK